MIFWTTGELNRTKLEQNLRMVKKQPGAELQVERLEKLLQNGLERREIPPGFYPLTEQEKYGLKEYIGMRQVYVSVVDHNNSHLRNAFDRDAKIKESILNIINSDDHPLVVLYDRDQYSFFGACLADEYSLGACFLRGECYHAFIQSVVYEEKTDEGNVFKPATLVRLFRLPK